MSILELLLAEDGIHLPEAGGAEKTIRCFSPSHEDSSPSMSINVAHDRYFCHGCGIKGGTYTYLTDIRGLAKKEAFDKLRKMGATDEHIGSQINRKREGEQANKRLPKTSFGIPDATGKDGHRRKVAEYNYTNEAGELLFVVARYEWDNPTGKRNKTFLQLTKRRFADGYWVAGPASDTVPEQERLDRLPLYNIAEASARLRAAAAKDKSIQTWVVEGEKCVELARRVVNKEGKRMRPNIVSPCGGSSKRIETTDWSPLYGHKVLIWADADEAGRKFAKNVAKHLFSNQCEVKLVVPPGDDGYDIADAIAIGGWEKLLQFLNAAGGAKRYDEVISPKALDIDQQIPANKLANTPYFRIMGMIGDKICVQSKQTHKIYHFPPGALTAEGCLLQIAPASWWDAVAGGNQWTQAHKRAWADAMIRAAEKGGELDLNNTIFWRRGARAYKTPEGDEKVMFHAGNRLLYEDAEGILRDTKSLSEPYDTEIYLPGPSIPVVADKNAAQYARDFAEAVMGYRWITPEHGHVLLGWIVTSLVGGALRFRPAVWLTAAAGTGKTYVLDSMLKPIFGDLVMPLANATEAGLAALSTDSALPAMLDEFEPERGREGAQTGILNLLRIATSGDGMRLRGRQDGGVISTRPRFSLFMSSIDRPILSEANIQRIYPIRLSDQGVKNWLEVERKIEAATTPSKCLAIRSHIILHSAKIAAAARNIEKEYIRAGVATRESQIRGALSAGASFLMGDPAMRLGLRREQKSDEYGPLGTILAYKVRCPPYPEKSLAEALQLGFTSWEKDPELFADEENGYSNDAAAKRKLWGDTCRRYGLMIEAEHLVVAEKHPEHKRLLRDSHWQNIDLDEYITKLRGAVPSKTKSGQRRRLKFGPTMYRSTVLPRETVEEAGFHVF